MTTTAGLQDSCTGQGLWWLAGLREDEVSGTLSYDPDDGAKLDLLGTFGELNEALKRALGGGGRDGRQSSMASYGEGQAG